MRVITPAISWHDRQRVSAVDFQPSPWPEASTAPTSPSSTTSTQSSVSRVQRRMASAGDDHHVVIWDVRIEDGSDGADAKVAPVCLCDLNRHQNSVNIVKWSPDGKLLASGDTDGAVLLWHYSPSAAAPDLFGVDQEAGAGNKLEEESEASENWVLLRALRGHLQDVIGIDFAPCSNFLISCSIDNTAIIFDVNKGTKLKMLSEHKGWVNGVTWDPRQIFIASIASDRVLRLYDTRTFKTMFKTYKCKLPVGLDPETNQPAEERSVRLFHDDTFKSFHRRMDFSPDGEILVVPSGVIEVEGEAVTPHCTYVFSRLDFSKPVMYLPNKEFSVAVRFSPVKYKLRNLPVGNSADTAEGSAEPAKAWEQTQTLFCLPYRMIFAVATQNTVMLYDTQQQEPFGKVSQIHYIGLTDVTWSADGNVLLVSSTDGFCSVITFKEGEIGERFDGPEEDKENIRVGVPDKKAKRKRKSKAKEDANDEKVNGDSAQVEQQDEPMQVDEAKTPSIETSC